MNASLKLAALSCGLALSQLALADLNAQPALGSMTPATGNTSAPSNWRFAPGQVFNGVAGALDGVARLSYTNADGGWACSGSLLQGGQYVLTAAHCADDFTSMTVEFGWFNGTAQVTRTVAVGQAFVHSGWTGALDTGADIAILKLNAPVTTINGYKLSTTNDVGKQHLMAGYGTTQDANINANTNWGDGNYGHYGYNTFDVTSVEFNVTAFGDDPNYYRYGATYMVDFDRSGPGSTAAQRAAYNVLGRVAGSVGGGWTSDQGLGANEALIAGGDSGGGDFVWNGSEWILSGVHSWGANNACAYFYSDCGDFLLNPASYGDLSGSTATFSHIEWINSIVNTAPVPEPETYALMLAGLGLVVGVARRRRV